MKYLISLLKPYKLRILLGLLLAAGSVFSNLSLPILFGRAIDHIAGPAAVDFSAIARIGAQTFGLVVFSSICQYLQTRLCNAMTYGIVRSLREQGMAKIQRLPVAYLDAHPPGEQISILISDAEQLSDGILMGFTQFFTGVLTIFGTLFFMLSQDLLMSAMVMLITPLSLFVASFIARKTHALFLAQASARQEVNSLLDEMVSNEKTLQAYRYENRAAERFKKHNETLQAASLQAIFYSSLTNPSTRFVNNILYACLACLGGFRVLHGAFSIGALTSFLSYATQYTKPFNEISGVFAELQGSVACAERIRDFLALEEEPDFLEAAESPSAQEGEVEFKRIDFSYVPEKPFIKGLAFKAEAGRQIAIVGPTGCGKTTLMNLLMRFFRTQSGQILLDGRDIASMNAHELRKAFGMVLQETWVRQGSVRENIALGREEASLEEVVSAAKEAGADSFISALPQGYDTVLEDGIISLSEGQRQLLCIARIFLVKPSIILLDEATSSIDTMTEKRIGAALSRLMENKTAFIVAHRLSTIRHADLILVMKDGAITERGNHSELLAQNGFYAALLKSQYAGVSI
ncbi:MAG: ABC transporter ATP-binding protein [Lachnospiraceae bacterium]|nr:ABC transporter ATP-binding protein [Lachnospiraceae bacterium]